MFCTFQGTAEPSDSGTLKESKPTRGLHACGNYQELREAVLHGGSTHKVLPSPSDSTPQRSVTQDSQWDEERRERDPLPAEADDVNALSLPFDRQASYLGISSIRAALAAMLQVRPQLRGLLASRQPNINNNIAKSDEVRPCYHPSRPSLEYPRIKWSSKGQALVDAYFQRIHIFTPMLDETSFRTNYLGSQRQDSPWLALLNMVLAMGSIVASKSSDRDHCKYYTEAMRHLDLNAFGSSHIETLQALALAGGYYLHYINRPNRGNAILGAAFRMASALGFHRESSQQDGDDDRFEAAEVRRRTWWSLVCLDTWTTTTLGRPSFGRFSPSIDIQLPKLDLDGEEEFRQDMGMITLAENIRFCRIATEIQDSLAVTPVLNPADRDRFDEALISWHSHLPAILSNDRDCDEPVHLARCVMRWRYWNLRMLLYRPALLDATTNTHMDHEVDHDAIETCQQLSKTAIEDIAKTWLSHQMSGWNAVWFLYQAAMIPLLSMLWLPQSAAVAEWRNQVQIALRLFDEMQDWSLTARCSKGVVSQIFEASCDLMCQGEQSCLESDMNHAKCSDQDSYLWADGLEVDDVLNMLCQDWSWDANCTWTEDEFVNRGRGQSLSDDEAYSEDDADTQSPAEWYPQSTPSGSLQPELGHDANELGGRITSSDLLNLSDALDLLAQVADLETDVQPGSSLCSAGNGGINPLAGAVENQDYYPLSSNALALSDVAHLLRQYRERYHPFFPIANAAIFGDSNILEWIKKEEHLVTAILTVACKDDSAWSTAYEACSAHMETLISKLTYSGSTTVGAVEALLILAEWTPQPLHHNYAIGCGKEVRFNNHHPAPGQVIPMGRDAIELGGGPVTEAEEMLQEAERAAREADVAIVAVGLNQDSECEGYDRDSMKLPGKSDELVERVLAANPLTVVILQSGTPVELPWVDHCQTLLQGHYGGNQFGNGKADVIFGARNPSGRLSVTYPYKYQHNPAFYNWGHEDNKTM
ncbi:hypothetical protein LZL87_012826 [Fusarium oxysporum]|nr:hypothetical protein LZL87_012826 [Fusarium oxysporum]